MHERITEAVTLIGGPAMSDGQDCLIYAVDLGELILIDCGAGPSWPKIRANMESAGLDPATIHTLVLTHCHVDHIGAASRLKEETGCRIVAHHLDAGGIESGDPRLTASSWYGIDLPKLTLDHEVDGKGETLSFSGGSLDLLHTPGHTPGSMVVVMLDSGSKVLFGQDIHGPFSPDFRSDVEAWRQSMEELIALDADILCEGHYGVFRPKEKVRGFIEEQLVLQSRF